MAVKDWFNRKEAAAFLASIGYPIAPRTLERLTSKGDGPAYRRFRGRCVYHRPVLEAWVQQHAVEIVPDGHIPAPQPALASLRTGALAGARR